jgi:predicted Zn-dependent protease
MYTVKSRGSTLVTSLLDAAPLAAQFGGPPLPEAARRGDRGEAQKHVTAAKAILERDHQLAHGSDRRENQAQFMPYLTGYVALYLGDTKTAIEDLRKASPNDPFYQCLLGEAHEKPGEKDQAMECYRKAAATTAHNPAAFARPFARKKLGD